ncbi:hypothetical protein DB346_24900 [Verrucomicrobia bacterium LW23]|nr:hypothetical protein DB346_24900 [Verrucomicrobia bacterium LW23]
MSGDDLMDSGGFSMLELFRAEAEGQTQALSNGLVALETTADPDALLAELMRAAHSIKGAARIVALEPAERVAHMMEDVFVAAQQGRVALGAPQVDDLLTAVDFLTRLRTLQEHEVDSWKASVRGEVAVLEARLCGLLESDAAASALSERALARQRADEPAPKSEVVAEKHVASGAAGFVQPLPPGHGAAAAPHTSVDDAALEKGELSFLGLFREELARQAAVIEECLRAADETHDALHAVDKGAARRDMALQQEMIQACQAAKSCAQIVECVEIQELASAMEHSLSRWRASGQDLATQRSSLLDVAVRFFHEAAASPNDGLAEWLERNREAMQEVAVRLRSASAAPATSSLDTTASEAAVAPVASVTPAATAAPAKPRPEASPRHLSKLPDDAKESHTREVAAAMAPRNEATVRISAELLSSLTGLAAEVLVGSRQMEALALRLTAFRQEQNKLGGVLARMQSGAITGEGVRMGLTPGELNAMAGTGGVAPMSAHEHSVLAGLSGLRADAQSGVPLPFLPTILPGGGAIAGTSVSSTTTTTTSGGGNGAAVGGARGYLLTELTHILSANSETLAAWMQEFDSYMHRFGNTADRLYQAVLSSRMRPFADGTHGFPRLVRDLSRQLGKKVRMQIMGEDTKVDREILEKLEAPLTHLIRNAVDHGLETPEERRALGKPEEGVLRVEARHRGGVLVVTLSDDGHGICIDKLRQKVVERGLETAEVVGRLSEAEVMEFLFLPGFSTATRVTDVSGRGVGLDVVRHVVQAAGGSVNVHARENVGTTFQISVPITRSVIKALIVRVADEPYALPLARIDKTASVPRSDLDSLEGRMYLSCNQYGNVGLVSAQEILKLASTLDPQPSAEVNVVVVSDRMNRYGLVVDEFLGARDLVVRPLDPRLGKVPDISSASVMEDGRIALVLDVDDLVRSIDTLVSGGGLRRIQQAEAPATRRVPRVLVVDDSITVREAERRLLENYGYSVDVAVDGMEGWNMVRASKYDLVVTDVDMPRMTGIDLVRKIKEDVRLKSLPVMIVSYKDRPEDRAEGLDAGADHYFPKSSFHDAGLVSAVEDLIGKAV